MRRTVVRYRVKPDRAEENAELVRGVYEELNESKPDGIHYATFQLEDGVTFVHVAVLDDDAELTELDSFKRFQKEVRDRCDSPPEASSATEVGSYGLFDG